MLAYQAFRRRIQRAAARLRRRALLTNSVTLVALAAAHTCAMHAFEELPLDEAAWLTLTTLTTVGYGDVSAVTPAGRIATTVLLYFGGIFLLAKTAGDLFDHRHNVAERKRLGTWNWTMHDHLVILGAPAHHADTYFRRLFDQIRAHPETTRLTAVIITDSWPSGLPHDLAERDVHLVLPSIEAFQRASLATARALVVLSPGPEVDQADAIVFDTLSRAAEAARSGTTILAECRDDANRNRFLAAGASTVLRPLRGYPEMIARELAAPGSSAILTDLFRTEGNECVRVPCRLRAVPWRAVAAAALDLGAGTPIGYAGPDGQPVLNPAVTAAVDADALYVIAENPADPRLQRLAERCGTP